jgi:hypothetical protein
MIEIFSIAATAAVTENGLTQLFMCDYERRRKKEREKLIIEQK